MWVCKLNNIHLTGIWAENVSHMPKASRGDRILWWMFSRSSNMFPVLFYILHLFHIYIFFWRESVLLGNSRWFLGCFWRSRLPTNPSQKTLNHIVCTSFLVNHWGGLPILSTRGSITKIYYIISDFRMVTIFEKYIQCPPLILAPLVNMTKGGCENKSALFILFIFHSKNSQNSNLSLK